MLTQKQHDQFLSVRIQIQRGKYEEFRIRIEKPIGNSQSELLSRLQSHLTDLEKRVLEVEEYINKLEIEFLNMSSKD
jgi:hypothetical protein